MKNFKRYLKKSILLLLVVLFAFSFSACSIESVEEHEKKLAKEAEKIEQLQKIGKETAPPSGVASGDSEGESNVQGIDSESSDGTNNGANGGNAASGNASQSDSSQAGASQGEQSNAQGQPVNTQTPNTPVTATVSINVKTRDAGFLVQNASINVEDGTSVFNVMKQAQTLGILTIDYRATAYGKYISAINGIYESGSQAGWKFQINGVDSGTGVSSATIHNGDVITWYYVYSAWETLDY